MHAVIETASGTKAAAMMNHELIMEAPRPDV
jgi:hypothetical protein